MVFSSFFFNGWLKIDIWNSRQDYLCKIAIASWKYCNDALNITLFIDYFSVAIRQDYIYFYPHFSLFSMRVLAFKLQCKHSVLISVRRINCNQRHNILRHFDVLILTFLMFYLQTWYIWVASRVAEWLKT